VLKAFDKWLTKHNKSRQKNATLPRCYIEWCDSVVFSRRLCSLHYQRNFVLSKKGITRKNNFVDWYAYMYKPKQGSITDDSGAPLKCVSKGCLHTVYAKGFCNSCYQKERRKKMNDR